MINLSESGWPNLGEFLIDRKHGDDGVPVHKLAAAGVPVQTRLVIYHCSRRVGTITVLVHHSNNGKYPRLSKVQVISNKYDY